jgi:hypothetical protein
MDSLMEQYAEARAKLAIIEDEPTALRKMLRHHQSKFKDALTASITRVLASSEAGLQDYLERASLLSYAQTAGMAATSVNQEMAAAVGRFISARLNWWIENARKELSPVAEKMCETLIRLRSASQAKSPKLPRDGCGMSKKRLPTRGPGRKNEKSLLLPLPVPL